MLQHLLNKNEIQYIIYRAEIASPIVNKSVSILLDEYMETLTNLDYPKYKYTIHKLGEISRRIKSGVEKEEIYKDYLPKEIIVLLKTAKNSGLNSVTSSIFKEYVPAREIGDKLRRRIKRSLTFPFIMYILASTGFYFLIEKFTVIMSGGIVKVDDSVVWISENYPYFVTIYGAIFFILLVVIPDKSPLTKKVFNRIEALLAVAITNILYRLNQSAGSIIPIIIQSFNTGKYHRRGSDVKALSTMLYKAKYVDGLEASDMINAEFIGGDEDNEKSLKNILRKILKNKQEEADELSDIIGDTVKSISILLIAFPLFIMLYIIGSIIMAIMGMI